MCMNDSDVNPYCDTIIRRWQAFTGKRALHADTGRSFEEMEDLRMAEAVAEAPTTGDSGSSAAVNQDDRKSGAGPASPANPVPSRHTPE